MKDDSLSDVSKFKAIKRSECKCICHTDAVALGLIEGPMHVMPCCEENIVGMGNQYKSAVDKVNSATDKEVWALPEANKLRSADIQKLVASETSVYARSVWNTAIEAAVKVAETEIVPQFYIAEQIRKLKK